MNAAAYKAVSRCDDVNPVAPVNPPIRFLDHIISKGRRSLGIPGDFHFFSNERLSRIAKEVQAACDPNAQLDFFHGFTPWIQTNPQRPYLAWSDCLFHDYIRIYHRCGTFRRSDIDRIEETESAWLNRAVRVLFTSQWAASRAVEVYGIPRERTGSVGIFGEVEIPATDAFAGASSFLFASTNFKAKGGPTVVAAFERIRQSYPEATLTVIGDSLGLRDGPGIIKTGFLQKENPADAVRFRDVLSKARAIVHPTRSDILPLILIEAGYFGVPSISSNIQAISEWIAHGSNGILLSPSNSTNEVESAMQRILTDPNYNSMRTESWRKAREEFPVTVLMTALSPR
jgi:glycosyltransferase involved in cell wall biosynthesis